MTTLGNPFSSDTFKIFCSYSRCSHLNISTAQKVQDAFILKKMYSILHVCVCVCAREQDSPPASSRLDAFTSRLGKRVQVGKCVFGAIVLSPTDAANQKAVVDSAQSVVVARARAHVRMVSIILIS